MIKKRFHKFKLLLDEALPPRQSFSFTNHDFDLKHINHDLKLPGLADEVIYKIAVELERIIITSNIKHFRQFLKGDKIGVIGVSMALKTEELDKKLCSLLKKSSKADLYGKVVKITSEKG
jgi:predicted nuclease of predicted toxin-antitoxin system